MNKDDLFFVIDALPETNQYERQVKRGIRATCYHKNTPDFIAHTRQNYDHFSRVTPTTKEPEDFKQGAYAITQASKAVLDFVCASAQWDRLECDAVDRDESGPISKEGHSYLTRRIERTSQKIMERCFNA